MCIFRLIFDDFFVCNVFYFVSRVIPLATYQKPYFAVSPEIVPAPESYRNVFTLALTRSWRSITFGRSFSCQGAREKNIPQGVTFKTPIFVRFFKTFFKKLKVCSVAQKHPSLGRHLARLKKRLFLKLFHFRLNCTTKKPSHRQHK